MRSVRKDNDIISNMVKAVSADLPSDITMGVRFIRDHLNNAANKWIGNTKTANAVLELIKSQSYKQAPPEETMDQLYDLLDKAVIEERAKKDVSEARLDSKIQLRDAAKQVKYALVRQALLDDKDLWRYCIPEKDHLHGKRAYEEQEPGYIDNMMEAMRHMLSNVDQPLAFDMYLSLARLLHGKRAYEEQEPGYIDNMMEAMRHMLSNVDQPLAFDMYLSLARLASGDKELSIAKNGRERSIYKEHDLSDEYLRTLIEESKLDDPVIELLWPRKTLAERQKADYSMCIEDILDEIKSSIELYNHDNILLQYFQENHGEIIKTVDAHARYLNMRGDERQACRRYRFLHEPTLHWIKTGEDAESKVEEAFINYERKMPTLAGDKAKQLKEIITLIHRLNGLIHCFPNNNLRVNGHLLFLRELIRFGFAPIILNDYMIFEKCTPDEIFNCVEDKIKHKKAVPDKLLHQ